MRKTLLIFSANEKKKNSHARKLIFPSKNVFLANDAPRGFTDVLFLEWFQFSIYCSQDQTFEFLFIRDNRNSILFVKSVVFPTRKALFWGLFPIIEADKIAVEKEKRISVTLCRCFSFVIYANELYMRSVRNVTNNITLLIVMQQWIIILFKHSLW